LRRFALLHGVHVWLIAHPTKLQKAIKGKFEGQYAPPTPYDISGSSHFRNKADNCLSIWRDVDANDNRVTVYVQKVRFLSIGKPGENAFIYEPACGRFREPRLEDQAWSAASGASNGVLSGS
jgi:twinkle protein